MHTGQRFSPSKSDISHRSSIGIGFSSKTVPLSRMPGWEPESWAYHGDDGHSYCCQNSGKHYGPPFTAGDVIGCGVNFRTGSAFFTKNGDHLGSLLPAPDRNTLPANLTNTTKGTAFREIKGKLYPSVGMKKAGEHVRVNFGQSPFIFDIDGMMSASNP
jgi:Ran-binding protein 9/10